MTMGIYIQMYSISIYRQYDGKQNSCLHTQPKTLPSLPGTHDDDDIEQLTSITTHCLYSSDSFRRALLENPLCWEDYVAKFQLLLYLEEQQMEVDIKRYNIPNNDREEATMTRDPFNKRLLVLEVSISSFIHCQCFLAHQNIETVIHSDQQVAMSSLLNIENYLSSGQDFYQTYPL